MSSALHPTGMPLAHSRTLLRILIVAAMVAVMALTALPQAQALGQRVAYRSCGSNLIDSHNENGNGVARTEWLSGSCNSRLSVAGIYTNGVSMTPRYYGDTRLARVIQLNTLFGGGYHWGCDSGCTASKT